MCVYHSENDPELQLWWSESTQKHKVQNAEEDEEEEVVVVVLGGVGVVKSPLLHKLIMLTRQVSIVWNSH